VDKNDPSYIYQIISYDPQIVCVRIRIQGVEVLSFRKDTGDYYFLSTTYLMGAYGKIEQGGSFTIMSYGTFVIRD